MDGVARDFEGWNVAAVDDDADGRAALAAGEARRAPCLARVAPTPVRKSTVEQASKCDLRTAQRHLTSTSSSQVPARSVLPSAVKVIVAGRLSVQ